MSHDTILGLYVYAMHFHGGQWSRLYRLLSRIESRYRPRITSHTEHSVARGGEWRKLPGVKKRYRWIEGDECQANEVYRRLKQAKFGQ